MNSLYTNEASHLAEIPTKILKQKLDFFSPFILGYVNKSISSSTFPSILKLAGITPVYKKDSRYGKSNYRPISVLPNLPRVFENIVNDQISFLKIFSLNIKLVCGKASISKVFFHVVYVKGTSNVSDSLSYLYLCPCSVTCDILYMQKICWSSGDR